MKAGTSWIHNYLDSRGDIRLPNGAKETFFFDARFELGVDWYRKHFEHHVLEPESRIVEVAPSYFHNLNAPERIKSTLGDVPIIVTLRAPVKRAWSHYLHLRRYGYTKRSLQEAAKEFPEIIDASRYQSGSARWEAAFGSNLVHVLWLEDLKENPQEYTKRLCDYLDIAFVAPDALSEDKQNQAAVPASSSLAAAGTKVTNFLKEKRLYSVVNLAKYLGLKKVFYGKPGSGRDLQPTDEEMAWLQSQLAGEIPSEAEKARKRVVDGPSIQPSHREQGEGASS